MISDQALHGQKALSEAERVLAQAYIRRFDGLGAATETTSAAFRDELETMQPTSLGQEEPIPHKRAEHIPHKTGYFTRDQEGSSLAHEQTQSTPDGSLAHEQEAESLGRDGHEIPVPDPNASIDGCAEPAPGQPALDTHSIVSGTLRHAPSERAPDEVLRNHASGHGMERNTSVVTPVKAGVVLVLDVDFV